MRKLANHRRLNYSRRCAEARIAAGSRHGDRIGCCQLRHRYERDASEFHEGYCGQLIEKALEEVTFVLLRDLHN